MYIGSILDFKKGGPSKNIVKELGNSDTTEHLPKANTKGE